MPLYEYDCQDCGERFELLVRHSDAEKPQECPSCQGQQTVKRMSVFAAGVGSSSGGYSAAPSSSGCGSRGFS